MLYFIIGSRNTVDNDIQELCGFRFELQDLTKIIEFLSLLTIYFLFIKLLLIVSSVCLYFHLK